MASICHFLFCVNLIKSTTFFYAVRNITGTFMSRTARDLAQSWTARDLALNSLGQHGIWPLTVLDSTGSGN